MDDAHTGPEGVIFMGERHKHDVMELGPTKEVKRRARRFRHDNEEARMKRLGTEAMEGQMPCYVQWAGDGFRDKMKTEQDAQRWLVRMS